MITFSAFADEIGADLKLQMDTCDANGIRCIDVRGIDDINVAKMTLAQAAEYKKQLDDRGFTVPCIGSPIGKIKISDDFEEHLELLKHCCEVAKAFGADRIRMFSFYPTEGRNIEDQRQEVMQRLVRMLQLAEQADVVLYHENESGIYGSSPDGCKDIFTTIRSHRLRCIFDPANFVNDGFAPHTDCWTKGLGDLTEAFHIKDKLRGQSGPCVPAGAGDGQFEEIFTDLRLRNWSGYMTLEPHLAAAGQFKGHTGPELFGKAVTTLKSLCDRCGLKYKTL